MTKERTATPWQFAKTIMLVASIVVSSGILSACGATPTPEPAATEVVAPTEAAEVEEVAEVEEEAEEVTEVEEEMEEGVLPVTILINDSPWFPGFETLVNLYQEETGNEVILNVTPFNGMLQKTRNAVQGAESEFDVINLNEAWYSQFYADGVMTPIKEIDPDFELDPEIIEYAWATRWDPEVNFSTENGEIYGLPINGNIQLFFYRKDLFAENDIAVPETWDDVEAAAQVFHDPDDMFGYAIRTEPPTWNIQAFINGYGGSIVELDEESGEWAVVLHEEPAVEALKTWLHLGRDYGPANYASVGQAEMLALMASGKLAQVTMVGAAAPNFDDPETSVVVGNVGATVVPGPAPGQRATMSGIWVMGIPHNLPMERKEAALTFLKWALTEEAQLAYAKAGAIPVRQDVYEGLADDPELGWWMGAMAESTPFIKPLPRLPEIQQILEPLERWVGLAVIDEASPEDALWEAAQEIHQVLVDAGYQVKPLER
ncbi:MAG: extracellular solute-binding protein [Chloroflexota bacterium]|nr:extracellular solute-binding protein [Chloroflexota bacterium]